MAALAVGAAPRILLIDNYDSYTWNLFQLLWTVSGARPTVVRNDEAAAGDLLDAGYSHVVLSPGPGSAARMADFGVCGELLARLTVPCLGVCLGHEGLALVFGGAVAEAHEIMHGRRSAIRHAGTGLFAGIPQDFRAVRYHSLVVVAPVPDPLVVTAWTADGTVMGLAHRDRPIVGVQFHPESIETEFGERLVRNFLAMGAAADRAAPVPGPPATRRPRRSERSDVGGSTVQWRPFEPPVPAETLFARVFAYEPDAFWLDSSRQAYGMGRYSYLGASTGPTRTVARAFARAAYVDVETGDVETGDVETGALAPGPETSRVAGTVFDYLRDALAATRVSPGASPVPFAGGFVGYLGYGAKGSTGIGRAGDGSAPDAELMRIDRFVAYDHETGRRYLVTVGLTEAADAAWCADVLARAGAATRPESLAHPEPALTTSATIAASVDEPTYKRHFETVQTWLRAGESYEACYTYQLALTTDADPLDTYRRLREASPAPYAALLRFGTRRVLSSSPERFLTVDPDGHVETKPIKGTAPRSPDPLLDAAARDALAGSEKTRSENLMIVDLMRNDLGRVCDRGTVQVPELMAVESYASVHQLVTTVRGRLTDDNDAVDCVAALFPGGSMTGAPKLRTVQLLDDLEPAQRGVYGGCLGFFGFDGRADLSIVIRTMVWDGNDVRIGVGGALTVLSDADSEYAETQIKARALLDALRVQPRP